MDAIIVDHAGKRIRDQWIYRDVCVAFEEGQIHGLIGRNGAGKTMLMKAICGLTHLSEGTITIEGRRLGVDMDIPDSIGVIIEIPGFLPGLSGYENLLYLAKLRNVIGAEQIRETMRLVGLEPGSKKRVGAYSLGMRQRLGIAQAIMEKPRILLLDEPMNGLDLKGVSEMKALLRALREEGKTILLASHHMEDISELCDTVHMMDNGKLSEASDALIL